MVSLQVNGKDYAGWKRVRITCGIESIAGSFDLEVSDRWDGSNPWPINSEDQCAVSIDGVTVITGYVDKRKVSYGAEEHTLSVSGRDQAGALVDCSAVLKSWEFHNLDIETIANRVANPLGITATLDTGVNARLVSTAAGKKAATGKAGARVTSAGKDGKPSAGARVPSPAKKFSINPGESAFEVLDRACRIAGVLPVSDGLGGIILTRAGGTRASTALVEGQNIITGSAEFDGALRYRTYVVAGQQQGSDDESGIVAAAVKATAEDLGVRRSNRVLYIRPEGGINRESAKNRAAWEASVRKARSINVTVTVQGWKQGNGDLWPINALVQVDSPMLGVKGDLLITQLEMTLDDGGEMTRLTLRNPEAFSPEPTISAGSDNTWAEIRKGV